MTSPDRHKRDIPVWDLPVRLFHWAIVALMPTLYVTWKWNLMDWHVLAGEATLALVLFRLLWGVFGSETARFAQFLAGPRVALRYLAHIARREEDTRIGHNPAGGWMVAVMLALLLGETLSGVFTQNDVASEGPFTETLPAPVLNAIDGLHTVLWNVLLGAIALHLLAILFYAVVKRQNLLRPMVTGRKTLADGAKTPRLARPALAVLLLGCAGGAAAAIAAYM